MQKSIANVIGNGASQMLYHTQDVFTVVCNTNIHTPHDVVSVIDHQPIDYWANNNITVLKKIWCSPKAKKQILKHRLACQFDCVHNSPIKYNNAQCVVLELLRQGYSTIHLYGCDTLWQEDMTSTQDTVIPRPHRNRLLYVMWRDMWHKIFAINRQVDYYIHSPHHQPTPHYGENVFWHQHLDLNYRSNK